MGFPALLSELPLLLLLVVRRSLEYWTYNESPRNCQLIMS